MVGDPRKQVEELQGKKVPNTPPKVLEERSTVASEAMARIRKGKKLCIEVVEAVSTMWEALMEDETWEKIKENMWQSDEKITTASA